MAIKVWGALRHIPKDTKIAVLGGLTFLGALLECIGLYKMAVSLLGMASMHGVEYVIIGFALGTPAAITREFVKAWPDNSLDHDKVAIQTLAEFSRSDRAAKEAYDKTRRSGHA